MKTPLCSIDSDTVENIIKKMKEFRATKLFFLLGSLVIQYSSAELVDLNMKRNLPFSAKIQSAFGGNFSRRDYLGLAVSLVGGLVPRATVAKDTPISKDVKESDFTVFQVHPDTSARLSPSLEHVNKSKFQRILSVGKEGGAVWLGEHHNSVPDHRIQAQVIKSVYNERKSASGKVPLISIGLEQVQVQFQPILDAFVAGNISEEEMLKGVDWEKRWFWPYEGYRPVFDLARELKIPLIALNVDSEDLAVVEKSGLQGLSQEQVRKYIKDPAGFAAYTKSRSFLTYASYVIEPSYKLHKDMGLLRTTISGLQLEQDMSYLNFIGGRILWDETMAGRAYSWTRKNPGGLMIGLIGADHIKFSKGIPGRFERWINSDDTANISVLLNPTLIDSRPPGTVAGYKNSDSSKYYNDITLQLRYLKDDVDIYTKTDEELDRYENTGGVLPISSYIVVSRT